MLSSKLLQSMRSMRVLRVLRCLSTGDCQRCVQAKADKDDRPPEIRDLMDATGSQVLHRWRKMLYTNCSKWKFCGVMVLCLYG